MLPSWPSAWGGVGGRSGLSTARLLRFAEQLLRSK